MPVTIAENSIDLLERGIEKLLYEAFSTHTSLYILGSGASARHSKMEHILAQTIVDKYYLGGSYDIDDTADNSLATNLIWRHMASHEDAFLKELSRKIPDSFIKTIINEEYAQLTPLSDNPEYQVFLLAKKGVTEQHYIKHGYDDEKRNALELWARKLKEIIMNEQMSNIVALTA